MQPQHNALIQVDHILVQLCFFIPLFFLVVYTFACPWWKTVFGRVIAALAFVFVAVLLRVELITWGVLPAREQTREDALAWFSVACLALAPVAFAVLSWQVVKVPVRHWLRWMHRGGQPNPVAPKASPGDGTASLSEYTEKLRRQRHHRSGQDVSPAADVDAVDSSPQD